MSKVFAVSLAWVSLALVLPMRAESALEVSDPRLNLEMRKKEQAELFDAQEQACAKTFAVTDCVNAVNARRRTVVAVLRKEENALNEAERRQSARERIKSLEEKARQQALQAPTVETSSESLEERQSRQQNKLAGHGPQSNAKTPLAPKETVVIDPQSRQRNAADYALRQKAAVERRATRDKKLQEQGKAPVNLPTPP